MIEKLKNKLSKDIHLAELLKASAIAFVLRLVGMLLGYIFTLLLAQKYGAEGTGIFALTLTYVSIATIFAKAGLDISTMKFIARFHNKNDIASVKGLYWKSLRILLVFSFIVSIIFILLSETTATYVLNKEYLSNAFSFAVLMIIPMALIQFHAEAIRGYKKIAYYFIINTISVSTISILLLMFNFKNIFSNYVYIDIYIIAQFLTAIFAIFIWLKKSNILKITIIDSMSNKTLFKASFPNFINIEKHYYA